MVYFAWTGQALPSCVAFDDFSAAGSRSRLLPLPLCGPAAAAGSGSPPRGPAIVFASGTARRAARGRLLIPLFSPPPSLPPPSPPPPPPPYPDAPAPLLGPLQTPELLTGRTQEAGGKEHLNQIVFIAKMYTQVFKIYENIIGLLY